ncbi:MAG: hypothetical protein O3A00_26035 [Planctomycetota bacterium]|nr:hypothetical protein [Planctomycetota bacterium]
MILARVAWPWPIPNNAWISQLQEALNLGALPDPFYAMGEQRSGDSGPDILALKVNVPLEETYLRSWNGVARRWKRVIEADD